MSVDEQRSPDISAGLNPLVYSARNEQFGPIMELAGSPGFINLAGAQHYRLNRQVLDSLRQTMSAEMFRYGRTAGEPALVEAISDRVAKWGAPADPLRNIWVTHGAGHAFMVGLLALISPGDEVLTLDPSFPLNWYTAEMFGASVVGVPISDPDAIPDDLERAITPRSKAIVLHPVNNPTGHVLSRSTVDGIAEVALRHNLFVLSDEVYESFVFDRRSTEHIAARAGMWERTLTIGSVSKDYNLPGMRIGWVVCDEVLMSAIERIIRNGPVGASVIGQYGALQALKGPQDELESLVDEFARTRDDVVRSLNEIAGVRCDTPEGGFFVFPDLSALGIDDLDLYIKLAHEIGVGVAPGSWYGENGSGHIRICYGAAPPDDVAEAMERLAKSLKALT